MPIALHHGKMIYMSAVYGCLLLRFIRHVGYSCDFFRVLVCGWGQQAGSAWNSERREVSTGSTSAKQCTDAILCWHGGCA